MPQFRTPSSKSSWIGMAAHEIDEITTYGASLSAKLARELADAIVEAGRPLLSSDPRALARANYSPEARRARIEREREAEARTRQILGEDDMVDLLRGVNAPQLLAA